MAPDRLRSSRTERGTGRRSLTDRSSGTFEPGPHRASVPRQALRLGQRVDQWRNFSSALRSKPGHVDRLHEIVRGQTRTPARRPSAREDVVSAGDVVPHRHRGPLPHEDRPCVLDVVQRVLAPSKISSRCSGANALAVSIACRRSRTSDRGTALDQRVLDVIGTRVHHQLLLDQHHHRLGEVRRPT